MAKRTKLDMVDGVLSRFTISKDSSIYKAIRKDMSKLTFSTLHNLTIVGVKSKKR